MHRALPLMVACVLLLAALSSACGGGDNGDNGGQDGANEPTRTRTSAATPSGGAGTATPIGADVKTPPPQGGTSEPQETAGNQPTAPPPATEGTPAVEPPDLAAYLSQYQGRNVGEVPCVYRPATRVTDCGELGRYAVNPPLGGQDIGCFAGIVDGTPEFIRCSSAQPPESKYYDIQ